jgi:hypothetical protein
VRDKYIYTVIHNIIVYLQVKAIQYELQMSEIGKPHPLLTDEHVAFLQVAKAFRRFSSTMAIDCTGYIGGYLTTIEFVRCHPRTDITFDSKGRNLSLSGVDVLGYKTYYSGVRIKIHFPPTPHRDSVVYQRDFMFSDYVIRPHHGYTIYMTTTGAETYQWETNRMTQAVFVDEKGLDREINVWIVSVTGS